jgi:ribosomal protein S7
VSINLTGLLEPMKVELYNELTALKKKYGFTLKASDDLMKIADASQSTGA